MHLHCDFNTAFLSYSFCDVLLQFSSTSFGNHIFSNYILIPLQQRYDVKYRKAIWGEYCDALRCFTMPVKSVSVIFGLWNSTNKPQILKNYLSFARDYPLRVTQDVRFTNSCPENLRSTFVTEIFLIWDLMATVFLVQNCCEKLVIILITIAFSWNSWVPIIIIISSSMLYAS